MKILNWIIPILVGCAIGFILRPQPDVAAAVAQAKRDAGDSATAAVSQRYLDSLVAPLRDTLEAYKGKPVAAAKIIVRRDTVRVRDTITITAEPQGDSAVLAWPPFFDKGIAVAETLTVTPPPVVGTRFSRKLGIAIAPDTILAALLQLPDGSQRFAALASGQGYTRVADAAVRPSKGSKFGFGCAAGPTLNVTINGRAYGGAGVTCGLAMRF